MTETLTELDQSAIWQVDDPITDEQLDFLLDEVSRLGQVYYCYLGKVACLTINKLKEES